MKGGGGSIQFNKDRGTVQQGQGNCSTVWKEGNAGIKCIGTAKDLSGAKG